MVPSRHAAPTLGRISPTRPASIAARASPSRIPVWCRNHAGVDGEASTLPIPRWWPAQASARVGLRAGRSATRSRSTRPRSADPRVTRVERDGLVHRVAQRHTIQHCNHAGTSSRAIDQRILGGAAPVNGTHEEVPKPYQNTRLEINQFVKKSRRDAEPRQASTRPGAVQDHRVVEVEVVLLRRRRARLGNPPTRSRGRRSRPVARARIPRRDRGPTVRGTRRDTSEPRIVGREAVVLLEEPERDDRREERVRDRRVTPVEHPDAVRPSEDVPVVEVVVLHRLFGAAAASSAHRRVNSARTPRAERGRRPRSGAAARAATRTPAGSHAVRRSGTPASRCSAAWAISPCWSSAYPGSTSHHSSGGLPSSTRGAPASASTRRARDGSAATTSTVTRGQRADTAAVRAASKCQRP